MTGRQTVRLICGLIVCLSFRVMGGEPEAPNALLQLFDGSSLHGRLISLNPAKGLRWRHPYATGPLRFGLPELAKVQFKRPRWRGSMAANASRIRLANGDEFYGQLESMDETWANIVTWFGGRMRVPRANVASVAFLENGYSVLYEGPNSMEEWVRGRDPNGWSYQDGMLKVHDRGVIGKDFGLTDSASVAFDVAWDTNFQLSVTLHTEVLDRYDYSRGAYVFFLSPQFVSFQRIQPGSGVMTLGQIRITNLVNRTRVRFDLRSYRQRALFALLADGKVIGTWHDSRGFIAKGKGVSFASQINRASFSVSNILVTEWDGTYETDFAADMDHASDALFLVNQDRPKGEIKGIQDHRVKFLLRKTREIDIPIDRVKRMHLVHDPPEDSPPSERTVAVSLSGGGSISLDLGSWDGRVVRGRSSMLGEVTFRCDAVRQLRFNLPRVLPSEAGAQEEAIWKFKD